MTVSDEALPKAPRLAESVLSLRLECADLDLNLAMTWPVKNTECVQFDKVLHALAAAGFLGSGYDLTKETELERFGHTAQRKAAVRREQHEFYVQVAQRYASMSDTLQTMKRDYYRELDHLRQQLSEKKRNPSFEADQVYFFDPAAYKLPAWEDVVEQLDGMRMKRELLLEQLGDERIRQVPLHMLCQKCLAKFQGPRQDNLSFSHDQCTQTSQTLPNEEVEDASVQTDWRVVLRPNPHGQPVLEVELPSSQPQASRLSSVSPRSGLPASSMPTRGEDIQSSGRVDGSATSAPTVQALSDSQGALTPLVVSAGAEVVQASMHKQSQLQRAAQRPDAPDFPDTGHDVALRPAAAQVRCDTVHNSKAEEVVSHLDPGHGMEGTLSQKDAASIPRTVHVPTLKVCHIAVQTDHEAHEHPCVVDDMSIDARSVLDPFNAETSGRRARRGEAESSESYMNDAANNSSLSFKYEAGGAEPIETQMLTSEELTERAQRMGAALQRVFDSEPRNQQRRSFSLWKPPKLSRKEAAALRLQRQNLALQKHQERQALSRLKRAADTDIRPLDPMPVAEPSASSRPVSASRPQATLAGSRPTSASLSNLKDAQEALSARRSSNTLKPLGVPLHQTSLGAGLGATLSNGTLGEASWDYESSLRRDRKLRSRSLVSLEEATRDSQSQLSPYSDGDDRTGAGRKRRPLSACQLSQPPIIITPREDSAVDPRASGKGLSMVQLGLQADSLRPNQRSCVVRRQPHHEAVKDPPHKMASRHANASRQSSPMPPSHASPRPPSARRQSNPGSEKGVTLPKIHHSPQRDDDRATRRSAGDHRSVMRTPSATRR